jgi:hypothetical protein
MAPPNPSIEKTKTRAKKRMPVEVNTVDAPLQPRPGWKLVSLITDN